MRKSRRYKASFVIWVGALASTSASAQSSVTLYGVMDPGIIYLSRTQSVSGKSGGSLTGLNNSGVAPSVFGMIGSEDLGDGLKAEFRLESGIDTTTGEFANSNGNLFGREAFVGLKGNFGEVKAGLQFSPFFQSIWDLDPRRFSEFGGILAIYANTVSATGALNSNAVSYTSPKIGGLRGSVMFAFGGLPGNFQAGRQYSASLNYDWSGLTLNAAFYNGNPGGTVNTIPATNVGFVGRLLAAAYSFGPFRAATAFTSFKVEGGPTNNVYSGGLDFLAAPQLDLNGGVWYVQNRNESGSHTLMGSVGAMYFLSKRTSLYTQVAVINNRGTEHIGLTPAMGLTTLYAPTGTTTGVTAGVMHKF
ncbi:Outer membrane protein (Porin) [Paraburkholderia tropica]